MESQMKKAKTEQETLTKENTALAEESKKLESSVISLKKESQNLKASMQRLREGRIAALTGEILAQSVVTWKSYSPAELNIIFDRLSDQARTLLAFRFGKQKEDIPYPIIDEKSKSIVRKNLENTKDRWALRMTALSNAVEGEPVEARIDSYKTNLIYQKKKVLVEKTIKAQITRPELEELIFKALRELNSKAAEDGLLRDPLTGNVGSVDTTELMSVLNSAVGSDVPKKLRLIAADDIYTEGPVRVTCSISNVGK